MNSQYGGLPSHEGSGLKFVRVRPPPPVSSSLPSPQGSEINTVRIEGKRKMVWAATIWMWLTSDGFGIMLVGAVLLEIVILIAAFNTKK